VQNVHQFFRFFILMVFDCAPTGLGSQLYRHACLLYLCHTQRYKKT